MKRLSLKKYFTGFDNVIRSLLVISLFLFFVTYFIFEEMNKLNYLMYAPAGMMGVLCVIYYIKKRTLPNVKPLICIYVFVGIAYLTSLIANPIAALTYRTLLVLAVFATVIYLSCNIIGNTNAVFYALLFASLVFVAAFVAVYWKSLIKLDFSTRLGRFFGNENVAAMKLAVSSALLASLGVYSKKHWLLPFAALIFILVASTGSKKGLLYVVIIVIFTICSLFRKRIWLGFLISFSAVLVMILAIVYFPPLEAIKSRFASHIAYLLGQSGASTSSLDRGLFRDNAFYLSFKNLFIGYGVDGFAAASGIETYSHNNISELMCDFGLFGMLSFYAIFIYIALTFKDVRKKLDFTIGFYLLLVFFLLTSTSQVFFYNKLVFFLFAICIFTNQRKNI